MQKEYIIDISGNNGKIDFERVKAAGIQGVMLKCTEGDSYLSPVFLQNYRAASAAGLLVGAYHYLRAANPSEAQSEGKWFWEHTKDKNFSLGLAVDIEPAGVQWDVATDGKALTPTEAVQVVKAFAKAQEDVDSCLQLYGPISYFKRFLSSSQLQRYPRWLANPDHLPFNWPVKMVQYSWKGQVDGISGPVDLNIRYPKSIIVEQASLLEPTIFLPKPQKPVTNNPQYRITGTVGNAKVELEVIPVQQEQE